MATRSDPLKGYNFLVSLLDSSSSLALAVNIALLAITNTPAAGFSECSGLEMTLEHRGVQRGRA